MMEDERDVRIDATRGQIEEFKGSLLWRDMCREMEVWKGMCKDEYGVVINNCIESDVDKPNTATTLIHLGDIHGRQKAMDYVMSMLDVFLQILEERQDDSGRK